MEYEFAVSDEIDEEFIRFLQANLREFNNQRSVWHRESRKPGGVVPLNLILRDANGQAVGGLAGNTYWDWLEIDTFYLPPEARGSGIGSRMLRQAEEIAFQRGCRHSFLTTYEFQARIFYAAQGYRVVGELNDYPPGSSYYWMRKDLSEQPLNPEQAA